MKKTWWKRVSRGQIAIFFILMFIYSKLFLTDFSSNFLTVFSSNSAENSAQRNFQFSRTPVCFRLKESRGSPFYLMFFFYFYEKWNKIKYKATICPLKKTFALLPFSLYTSKILLYISIAFNFHTYSLSL